MKLLALSMSQCKFIIPLILIFNVTNNILFYHQRKLLMQQYGFLYQLLFFCSKSLVASPDLILSTTSFSLI